MSLTANFQNKITVLDDVFLSGTFGATIAAAMDSNILLPIAASLFSPLIKELFSSVLIPYLRKRLKIKPENENK